MEFHHKPVLFHETIEALAIQPEGIYIDGTMGGGGHSEAILQRLTTGKLLSLEQLHKLADFAKKHKHEAEWIYRFVYVLPLSIKDKAMKFLEQTGRKGSVCIWFYSEEPWIAEKTGIPHNPKGRKMYLEELLKLARLGVMRYWNLRMKNNDETKEKIALDKEFGN